MHLTLIDEKICAPKISSIKNYFFSVKNIFFWSRRFLNSKSLKSLLSLTFLSFVSSKRVKNFGVSLHGQPVFQIYFISKIPGSCETFSTGGKHEICVACTRLSQDISISKWPRCLYCCMHTLINFHI